MREIEIKLRVKNLEELEKKLLDSGLKISKEITQHDTVYVPSKSSDALLNVKIGDVFIRIRIENGVNTLTLKQQRGDGLDKLEYETRIEDRDAIHHILTTLGWKPEVQVKKIRKKGRIGDYEICLDRVEELGDFIEIEKMTSDDVDPEKIKQELFGVLESYELSKEGEETKGCDILIYNLKSL